MAPPSASWNTDDIEKELQTMLRDGCLSDLVQVEACDLKYPAAVAPWNHLPFKLFESATVTRVLTGVLDHVVPGTEVTYSCILSAIMQQKHTDGFCYLLGGQVRDMLLGKVSKDIDFNYACTAQDVATVCVENEWPVKYKAIGPVSKPNYVLIGDEQTETYMEGFSISFNATSECFKQDFRQNMLFYDLTNHVILDKTGFGVDDIRRAEFRLSCAPSRNFDDWAGADMSLGQKGLRYVKFIVRANLRQKPYKIDKEESAFVVALLKRAFRDNAESLQGFWFGYVLAECLRSRQGLAALHAWVCEHGGAAWWTEWLPFVRPKVEDPQWLQELGSSGGDKSSLKQIFRSTDRQGDGMISEEQLKEVMLSLGTDFTEEEFNVLLSGERNGRSGKLKYDHFIDHLLDPWAGA